MTVEFADLVAAYEVEPEATRATTAALTSQMTPDGVATRATSYITDDGEVHFHIWTTASGAQ